MTSIQELVVKIKTTLDSLWSREVLIAVIVFISSLGSFFLGRVSFYAETESSQAMVVMADTVVLPGTISKTVSGVGVTGGEETLVVVASKNGSKYYLPWCSGQGRILEENKIYFATEEDAVTAGYEKAVTCAGL